MTTAMEFKDNDLIDLLYKGAREKGGSYDHLRWSMYAGQDATDIISQVISVHEFFHYELNNITGYGLLLQSMAYLAGEKTDKQDIFRETLTELVNRCRLAHESYATWLSVTVFRATLEHNPAHIAIRDNPEYLNYYRNIDELLVDIPSIYLQQQVGSVMLRSCFQSRKILDYSLRNLENFKVEDIHKDEFPDARLDILFEEFSPKDLLKILERSMDQFPESQEKGLLIGAMKGKENAQELIKEENNWVGQQLMVLLYAEMRSFFEAQGSPSLQDQEHLDFVTKQHDIIDKIAPFKNSRNPFYKNENPYDSERGMLINFQSETLIMNPTPLPCVVQFPDDMDESVKTMLWKGTARDPHLFLMGRNSLLLENQYEFLYEKDARWFREIKGPFTALRYTAKIDGTKVVFIVPFNDPKQLTEFLVKRDKNVPVIGCISISAAYLDQWWWDTWYESFTGCDVSTLVMDIAPLYYIEEVFSKEAESVHYGKMVLEADGIKHSAMSFQLRENDRLKAILIAPASDMHCNAIHNFIESQYPGFLNTTAMDEQYSKWIPMILYNIVTGEHTFRYRSEKIF